MATLTNKHSLSALSPIKLTYKFNNEERLSNNLNSLTNGFSFYDHDILIDAKDAVLSNHNLLILTDQMSLTKAFSQELFNVNVGNIAGSLYLKNEKNVYITSTKNNIYVGGTGNRLQIAVIPIEGNTVELFVDQTKRIVIDEDYPYTAKISSDILSDAKVYRQRFVMDVKDGKCTFQAKTKEGHRFLSYGADNIVRAIGVSLNEFTINPYVFVTEFITNEKINTGFNPKTSEIKYFNELVSFSNQKNVNIKTEEESNTHLLISCATAVIATSAEVPVNIALTKTNFSSSGSYSTKQT